MATSIANQISPSKVIGRLSEWYRRMEEAGLTFDDLQTPIDDPGLRQRLIAFWKSGGFQKTVSQERARGIMGKNFFCIEEAVKFFGVNPTPQQLAALTEIPFPFSEEVLEQSKSSHVLVAVFPLSILEIRGRVERELFYKHEYAWYNNESFAKDLGKMGWQLVLKAPVDTWQFQDLDGRNGLVGKGYPEYTAQIIAYTIIGHYLNTRERLFSCVHLKTSSRWSADNRKQAGYFNEEGLHFDPCPW